MKLKRKGELELVKISCTISKKNLKFIKSKTKNVSRYLNELISKQL